MEPLHCRVERQFKNLYVFGHMGENHQKTGRVTMSRTTKG